MHNNKSWRASYVPYSPRTGRNSSRRSLQCVIVEVTFKVLRTSVFRRSNRSLHSLSDRSQPTSRIPCAGRSLTSGRPRKHRSSVQYAQRRRKEENLARNKIQVTTKEIQVIPGTVLHISYAKYNLSQHILCSGRRGRWQKAAQTATTQRLGLAHPCMQWTVPVPYLRMIFGIWYLVPGTWYQVVQCDRFRYIDSTPFTRK